MNQYKAQTDGQTSEVVGSTIRLSGCTQHNQYEDAGEDNLGQQTTQYGDVCLQVVSTRTLQSRHISSQDIKQQRADEGTNTLEHDIHASVLAVHTSGQEAAQRDGRVDMATGDAANRVSHSDNSQTEGQSGTHYSGNVVNRITTQTNGYAAAHQHEHHSAHHFCKILFHNLLCLNMIKELTFMDAKLGILFDICKQNPKKMITFAPMITENPYVKQFPDLMAGKTLLYCHGFGSSGQSGTVTRLRTVMPQTNVIAPDLPVDPHEAIALLHSICQQEKPDLIIGTSMGGMYAEQLRGFDRICINPALVIAETMKAHGMTGTQQFQNPRQDGVQEFYVDKALVKAYREVSEQRFEGLTPEDEQRVIGLFGDQDDLVDTYDMFCAHYSKATHFHGEHRMDDKSYMHSVVPVIRWIDDRQEGRQREIIYIGLETMKNAQGLPASSVQKAVRGLIEHYEVFFVAPPADHAATASWLEEYINVPAWRHTIYTYRRDLLYGDFLITQQKDGDTMATRLEYGSDTFKTWEDIIAYFSHLCGQ